jgi:hypothetical protein
LCKINKRLGLVFAFSLLISLKKMELMFYSYRRGGRAIAKTMGLVFV